MNNATIYQIKDYGLVRIKLNQCLTERHMTKNALARSTNTRYEVVRKWCSGHVERIDADVLARFCYVLDCPVEDLIEYQK